MNKDTILQWLVRVVFIFYSIINIDAWVKVIAPIIYDNLFSKLGIYEIYNVVGGWLIVIVVALIVFHITHIFNIHKKIFWVLLILFLLNLLLMYLEVRRHGDS